METQEIAWDISRFCLDKGQSVRVDLSKAYVDAGFLYATNGHIAIRISDKLLFPTAEMEFGKPSFNIEKLIDAISTCVTFQSFHWKTLAAVLSAVKPIYKDVPEWETCSECMGSGRHECSSCGSVHECGNCDGEGRTRNEKFGRVEVDTPVPLVRASFNWFYLDLIKDTMKEFPGDWSAKIPGPNSIGHFKRNGIDILLMPMAFQSTLQR